MYTEDQLVMISALQHLAFCKRQCALIHVEQQWADNRATVLGELLHERVHTESHETRGDVRTARSLRLVSYEYGLVGQSDVVEFHKTGESSGSVRLYRCDGFWSPFPVEYKKGKPKKDNVDRVQLCAQAICLEEQMDVTIVEGSLYYGENRKRQLVEFDGSLRRETSELIRELHELIDSGRTPKAKYQKKCDSCSLFDVCQPKWNHVMTRRYFEKILFEEPFEP